MRRDTWIFMCLCLLSLTVCAMAQGERQKPRQLYGKTKEERYANDVTLGLLKKEFNSLKTPEEPAEDFRKSFCEKGALTDFKKHCTEALSKFPSIKVNPRLTRMNMYLDDMKFCAVYCRSVNLATMEISGPPFCSPGQCVEKIFNLRFAFHLCKNSTDSDCWTKAQTAPQLTAEDLCQAMHKGAEKEKSECLKVMDFHYLRTAYCTREDEIRNNNLAGRRCFLTFLGKKNTDTNTFCDEYSNSFLGPRVQTTVRDNCVNTDYLKVLDLRNYWVLVEGVRKELRAQAAKISFFGKIAKTMMKSSVFRYGKWCGMGYGKIRTDDEAPEDALDAACRFHDNCWADNAAEDCVCNRMTLEMLDLAPPDKGCERASADSFADKFKNFGHKVKCGLAKTMGTKYLKSKCRCLGIDSTGKLYDGTKVSKLEDCKAIDHPDSRYQIATNAFLNNYGQGNNAENLNAQKPSESSTSSSPPS